MHDDIIKSMPCVLVIYLMIVTIVFFSGCIDRSDFHNQTSPEITQGTTTSGPVLIDTTQNTLTLTQSPGVTIYE